MEYIQNPTNPEHHNMTFLFSLLFACSSNESGLLAIGDSYLAWHAEEELSIPHVAAEKLGSEISNWAISGSHMRENAEEQHIPSQYENGAWDWVIISGGGNDLNDSCECGVCDDVLDELVTTAGTSGLVSSLTESIMHDGHKVILLGYYQLPTDAEGFDNCNEVLPLLHERYQALADQHENLWFVDAGQVVSPEEREQYDDDGVHPSVSGAHTIGTYLAEQIRSLQ